MGTISVFRFVTISTRLTDRRTDG